MPPSASKALLDWYRANRRDLPWRHTDDPYAILVSEVMLQQTQVATVLPYFDRFMRLFPTASSLALAKDSDAMAAWAGLGYYRRLRNLKTAAAFVSEHGWPSDLAQLPGVGRYTAAAVGSIAFGRQVACADGNVRRVMSRLVGVSLSLAESEHASRRMMGRCGAGEWNQAVMELGALVCPAASPSCGTCPVADGCLARANGTWEEIPVAVKATTRRVTHACACFLGSGQVALRDAQPGEWWQGMLVFPFTEVECGEEASDAVVRLGLERARPLGTLRHTVTNHRVELCAFMGTGSVSGVEWHPIAELARLPLPAPQMRVAKWLQEAA